MKIVIIGQTNVGKSKLFNMLTQKNLSIVFDGNDTTVDYVSLTIDDKIVMDTAGIKSIDDVKPGDLYLYVVNARKDILEKDKTLISQVRRTKQPIWLIVNSIDGIKNLDETKFSTLGCNRIYYVSAEHNINIDQLREDLGIKSKIQFNPTIAILGRCNSGKSTLMNALLKTNRMIVSSKIGTTRDTVRETINIKDQSFDFMDTAGYRNNANILEHITAKRRENCLTHCVGSILVINGEEGFTNLDKIIFTEAYSSTNFVVIAVNKKDSMYGPLKFFNQIPAWIPVVYISALNSQLFHLKSLINKSYECSKLKITTNKLNRWLQKSNINFRSVDNKPINVKYITQFKSEPITIGTDKDINEQSAKQMKKKIAEAFEIIGAKIIIESM